ncbi:GNAT family N-acetyltransferase [Aeromicrobium alkaliterrae]|uniref:BioF2-like acetyltransferase domain-containing protein n=1 Tax=Aeromicrobium alkaliterrae TaxID=302168 RepID=A0ABP4VLD7_9ACTN
MSTLDATTDRTIRVVRVSSLGPWAGPWDELVAQMALPSPFLRSWWLEGVSGPSDHYVLVVEGDTLVGGLALTRQRRLWIERFRVLGHGTLCPDHLDLVATPDRAHDVARVLRGWFAARGSRLLDLHGLAETSVLVQAFADGGEVVTLDVAPFEALPADPDAYLGTRSSSSRQRYRQHRRRTEEQGVVYRRAADAEVPAALADFARLHGSRPDRARLCREMPRLLTTLRASAAAGELRVVVAEIGDRRGAVVLLFTTGRRLSFYQVARDVEDPRFNHSGTVVDMHAILEACTDGLVEVDFLRGDERYKRSFARDQRRVLRLRCARGLGARLWWWSMEAAEGARRDLGRWRRALRRRSGASG